MSRGRPRRLRRDIPSHIDQTKIPKGVYFVRNEWVVHKPDFHRIAGPEATLADLHQAAEACEQHPAGTSLRSICRRFMDSPTARKLAKATRDDYAYCISVLAATDTRLGCAFIDLDAHKITQKVMQRLVDRIGAEHPAKANHVARFLRRLYKWAKLRVAGIDANPAVELELATEKGAHNMPELAIMRTFIAYLERAGRLPGRRKGACPDYLAPVAVLAYRCRMRGVEVLDLTDASITDQGILVVRRKGSRPNITECGPDMQRALRLLKDRRARIWTLHSIPAPFRPEERPLVISDSGARLSRRAYGQAWGRAIRAAIEAGVIAQEDRFGLHGIKHRGVTDTEKREEQSKRAESGHQTERMARHYDHAIPVVRPAGRGNLI